VAACYSKAQLAAIGAAAVVTQRIGGVSAAWRRLASPSGVASGGGGVPGL